MVLVHPTFLHSTRGKVPGILVHEHEAVVVVEITEVQVRRVSLEPGPRSKLGAGVSSLSGRFRVYLV